MIPNYFNLVFIIDESGSMFHNREDVIGSFNEAIEKERKEIEKNGGKVTVSLFKFSSNVNSVYIGKDINDIPELEYSPAGLTALYDGVADGIDKVGEFLSNMDEKERPCLTTVSIMTDGLENASQRHSLSDVKEKIEHQTEKYGWVFTYTGINLMSKEDAKNLSVGFAQYTDSDNVKKGFSWINSALNRYRTVYASCADASFAMNEMKDTVMDEAVKNTNEYEKKIGKKLK